MCDKPVETVPQEPEVSLPHFFQEVRLDPFQQMSFDKTSQLSWKANTTTTQTRRKT